jgi:uncharacterized SAM-binding protein YcdF (DUF218 family)
LENGFFFASKFIWMLVAPANWLLLLPLLALLLHRLQWRAWAVWVWSLEVLLILLIGAYPVGQWLVKPLESYSTLPALDAPAPDGIIVLGGAWETATSGYWQQWELNHAAERELAFLVLAERYPAAKLVFTGGSGRVFSQGLKEAHWAEALYRDFGLDQTRLVLESESRNTDENARFSKRLVAPKVGEHWWLITSAYHMPRSVGVFCQQDWSVTPYPVDHYYAGLSWRPNWQLANHLQELEQVLHEWLGLVVYRITGKSSQLFPVRC